MAAQLPARESGSFSWSNVTITAKNGRKPQKTLLDGVSGRVEAGEMIAIMGPSGCGKTTLLNHLAHRQSSSTSTPQSQVFIDDFPVSGKDAQKCLRYVESHDVLIGSLTVGETLNFAAQMSLPRHHSREQRKTCVDDLLTAFGLYDQAGTTVGTLLKKGISTGQKRRLSVASQMAAAPRILLLDEPTSGLDSAASYTVMSYIRDVVKEHNIMVVCSIHQPSTTTFNLFDKLLLLSHGKTCYSGTVSDVRPYFDSIGYKMGLYINPAEYILDLVNTEVARDRDSAELNLDRIQNSWVTESKRSSTLPDKTEMTSTSPLADGKEMSSTPPVDDKPRMTATPADKVAPVIPQQEFNPMTTLAVLRRSWLKSRRDILVYAIRFGMYMGLAIMMGTVWLRLSADQADIQSFANCILFGSTFMSFMAVVYVPAFMEDRLVYIKDRENGLYGSGTFALTNFIIGLPYLFMIALCTSTFVYWMVNFRPSGEGFMIWVMWMYLNLLAAESLVVFIASLIPNFVGALALTAMANGIWMSCNGFMVAPNRLNPFWHYVFYYINYQAYVFRGLITNEFATRTYSCNTQCYCQYDTDLRSQCLIAGSGVLTQQYGFEGGSQGLWVGITVGIIAALRLFGWLAMEFRR